jgi:4-amino-4-deoxy-L-arabinose transferase-like glycosyltransferase
MHRAIYHNWPVFLFLLILFIIRLFVANSFGLGVDEAHYLLYGKNIALSYFDHPPLVGWVHALFFYTIGTSEIIVRLPAIILSLISSLLLYFLILKIFKDKKIAFISIVAVNCAIMISILYIGLIPDSILFVISVLIINMVIKTEQHPSWKNFAFLGVLLGLAGLSKYTAILLVPSILFYYIYKKRYDLLINKRIIITISISLVFISPVFVWNYQNDFISFMYQSKHVAGGEEINFVNFGLSILAQIVSYSIILFFVAYYGLYRSFFDKNDYIRFIQFFALISLLFFTVSSLYKTALPHWNVLFYYLFIPIGVAFLLKEGKKYTNYFVFFAILVGGILTSALHLELRYKFIKYQDYKSVIADVYGYDKIISKANELISSDNNAAIAVVNWTVASRALYYNLKNNSNIYLIDKRFDQFDFWEKKLPNPYGKNLLFINTSKISMNVKEKIKCDKIKNKQQMILTIKDVKVNKIDYIMCYNYRGFQK